MLIIGIDPGRANTGVAIWDNEAKKIVNLDTFELPLSYMRQIASFNLTSCRLAMLQDKLGAFLLQNLPHKEVKFGLTNDPILTEGSPIISEKCFAVIEDYAYGDQKMTLEQFRKMDKMSLEVGEVHGVIYQTIYRLGIPMVKVAPSQMKCFIAGDGQCEKTEIIKRMYKEYKAHMTDDHQADALALMHMGRYYALFCKNPVVFNETSYEYNVMVALAFNRKYADISKMLGLNL